MISYQEVIDFWFSELSPPQWFKKDDQTDQLISHRFKQLHIMAMKGELFAWRKSALGRLAEILVLDQFSRNIYRDTPQAFAADPIALVLAQEAVANKIHQELLLKKKAFLLMPYMHSESPLIHQEAVELYSEEGLEDNLKYELKHKEIIDRFGRYPHRNQILSRPSTEEELEFLKQPGSSF